MKYYYKLLGDTIIYIAKGRKVPKNCIEITKEKYEFYVAIMQGIENKDGYVTIVTLYVDGSYTVEYILADVEE